MRFSWKGRHGFPLAMAAIFLVGEAISLLMVARTQVTGEQFELLARGWWLLRHDTLIPFGMPASGGGATPGPATSVLTYLPLLIWRDYRAVALFISLSHAAAFLLIDRLLSRACSRQERVVFAILYWLNPARLFYSAFIWNPSFLPAFAALHLWTAGRMRERPGAAVTALHVLALALALQVHPSAVILVALSALLLALGRIRLEPVGALTGGALSAFTLAPWAFAVARRPDLLPLSREAWSAGLPVVAGLARGMAYWLRFPSLYVSGRIMTFVDPAVAPVSPSAPAEAALAALLRMLLYVSVVVPVAANIWFLRQMWQSRHAPRLETPRAFLRSYAFLGLMACCLVFCLAPTTVMSWQVLVALQMAVLPVVFWTGARLRSPRSRAAGRATAAYALVSVLIGFLIATGNGRYRCDPGRPISLRHDPVILHDLSIDDACTYAVDVREGWWDPILDRPDAVRSRTPLSLNPRPERAPEPKVREAGVGLRTSPK